MDATSLSKFPNSTNIMNYRKKIVHPLVSLISGGVAGSVEAVATVNSLVAPKANLIRTSAYNNSKMLLLASIIIAIISIIRNFNFV